MKVSISVGGRFHAFYLAQQLLKDDCLGQLITSYPKCEVKKYGIPLKNIFSVVLKEILYRGWGLLPGFIRRAYNPQYLIHEIYDYFAEKAYQRSDVCVAWASFGLRTIRKAKRLGAITVIERCSSHILYQTKILNDEYAEFGLVASVAHPKIIEKELQEYAEADYIAVPSAFVKKTFVDLGVPERKLIHVPYGVDISEFTQVAKPDDVFRVICCGGLSLRKGVHYLLKAFYELNLPNSELWLIGGLTEEIQPFLKKYHAPNISHKGPYPQNELFRYYSQGSVFVLASIEEGLAYVQAQAMACGLPVICTPNTGGEDIVRNGIDGYIVPIRDANALKDKLAYLYAHPEICRQMGQSAKQRVSSGFTWDDYGKKMCARYLQLVQARDQKTTTR